MRAGATGLEVVRYDGSGHTAEIFQRAAVRAQPVLQRLRRGGFDERVARVTEGCDKRHGLDYAACNC